MTALLWTLSVLAWLYGVSRYVFWCARVVEETRDYLAPVEPESDSEYVWLHKQIRVGVVLVPETVHARPGTVRRYRKNRRTA